MDKDEKEMIKRLQSALPDTETMRFNFDKIDLATYLYDAGCRIVGEDEIVIKKSEYEKLTKTYAAINSEAYYCGLSVGREEVASELVEVMYDLADKYGIEFYDTRYSRGKGND